MTASAEHWHLPGLDQLAGWEGDRWFEGRTPAGYEFRTPNLTEAAALSLTDEVHRSALSARRVRRLEEVVRTASHAACRLASRSDPVGEAAGTLLAQELGWAHSTAVETIAAMAESWTESALWRVIREELPDPLVLDEFRPSRYEQRSSANDASHGVPSAQRRRLRRRRATGPPVLLHVLAGNVPGVAVTAALRGLIVRSGVLCKTPQAEPGLLPLFGRALSEADPGLGSTVAATWWPADIPSAAWRPWVKRAGKVVVYGGAEAVKTVREHVPAEADLVVYGPKLGVAVLLSDAVDDETAAAGLARDVCAYDQQGCVSPRLAYVVGDVHEFADRLERALEAEVERLGRPAPLPEEAVAIRLLRTEAEWGSEGWVSGSEGDLAWTILIEKEPGLRSEALPRVLRLYPLDRIESLTAVLRPLEGRIQSIGYAGGEGLESLADQAAELGVSRVAPLGSVAWPPADWRHDGHHQLLPLLQWTDWESSQPA